MATHVGTSGLVKVGGQTVGEVIGFSIDETQDTVEDTALTDSKKSYKVLRGDATATVECHFDETDSGQEKEDDKKSTSVTTKSIDSIDGKNKDATLSGEEKVPGTEASAVAEIGVGDAMGCLSENNNDMSLAEECLESKLSKTKLFCFF